MKISKTVIAVILGSFLLTSFDSSVAFAVDEVAPLPLEAARKEVVKITDQGLVPQVISLGVPDSTVFLVNVTEGEEVTIALEFGKRRVHCHSKNLAVGDDGVMRTVKPVVPQDFAILCFPERGTYQYTVTSEASVRGSRKKNAAKTFSGAVVIN